MTDALPARVPATPAAVETPQDAIQLARELCASGITLALDHHDIARSLRATCERDTPDVDKPSCLFRKEIRDEERAFMEAARFVFEMADRALIDAGDQGEQAPLDAVAARVRRLRQIKGGLQQQA